MPKPEEQIVPPFSKKDIIAIIEESGLFQKRFEVTDIKKVPSDVLDVLKCGDVVVKRTVEGDKILNHAYIVTHKQETGICLSYNTTGYSETQSYDKIGGVWTYNSEDKWTAE